MDQTPKIDIFQLLGAIDKKRDQLYESLEESNKKQVQPFVLQRWMTGTSDPSQVFMVNEIVNPYAFSLTSHKQLLWQLLTVASSGRPRRYSWLKGPSHLTTGKTHTIKLLKETYGYSTHHAAEAVCLLTKDDVLELAAAQGWQQDDVAKLKREWTTKTKDEAE